MFRWGVTGQRATAPRSTSDVGVRPGAREHRQLLRWREWEGCQGRALVGPRSPRSVRVRMPAARWFGAHWLPPRGAHAGTGCGGLACEDGPTGVLPWETWGQVWGSRAQRPSAACPSAPRAGEKSCLWPSYPGAATGLRPQCLCRRNKRVVSERVLFG